MDPKTWQTAKVWVADLAELPASERAAYLDRHCADPALREEVLALTANPESVSDMMARHSVTPDRLARLEALYHAARAHAPEERAAYLADACSGDEVLRREVESLLTEQGVGLLTSIVVDGRSALAVGRIFGTYRIVEQIGAGGMGEVYRAHDTKLGREVALKVLRHAYSFNRDRQARLEREARLLASLNHPNIAQIHGLEEADGQPALVMELVEGPTLADRIARGRVPLDEALPIASQIAEALEAAHERGIVHRDLKPANIKIRADGTVKVLDFGLAKTFDPGGASATEAAHSPMTSNDATRPGVILGTDAYMAPEQARGKTIDRRADIWAFGCVLYEMLTRRRAFEGDDHSTTLAAVMMKEPQWAALPSDTPVGIRWLLTRCLKKDPTDRLQAIGDARVQIKEALAGATDAPVVLPSAPSSRWREALAWSMVAVVVLAAAAAARYLTTRPKPASAPSGVTRMEIRMPPGVRFYGNAALSPDGRRVAYIGATGAVRQVYVHELDQLESYPLPNTAADVHRCFFSFDGQTLGFYSSGEGTLKQVTLSGALGSVLARGVAGSATWGRDGQITFVHRDGGLWQVSASGGTPKQLTRLEARNGEADQAWPVAIGTGQVILFEVENQRGQSHIEAVSTATGIRTILEESGSLPRYAPSGHLLFRQGTDLYAAPFDIDHLTTKPALRVLQNVADVVSVSSTGSLLYSEPVSKRLVWVSREGKEESFGEARSGYRRPALSPDGRHIALEMSDGVWDYDLDHDRFTPLSEVGFYPVWADNTRVVLQTASGMKWIDTTSGKPAQSIPGSSDGDGPVSVAPDGNTLAFLRASPETKSDIYLGSLDGRIPTRAIVNSPAYEGGAQFSPRDGRYLAYVSDQSGRSEVSVCLLPECAQKWPVSKLGGTEPRWSRDGTELFYRSGDRMMSVTVVNKPDSPFSQPEVLFEHHYAAGRTRPLYDVAPDGRFLMIRDEPNTGGLILVTNWIQELKARMAAGK